MAFNLVNEDSCERYHMVPFGDCLQKSSPPVMEMSTFPPSDPPSDPPLFYFAFWSINH